MDTKAIENWLFDPTVGKIVATLLGVLIIQAISGFLQRYITRRIQETSARYRVRKTIAFSGYLLVILFITVVFSNRLGGLTVAFGVAGAGIAFALQEVIASIAGWFAITFADFYVVGDRVQLGGIKGDVIDIGILRTTLMEVGEWIKGDQYSGRIVRIANSFVFKEPVFNYSGDFPFLWDEITVPVKYGSDHRLARQILQNVADEVVGQYALSAGETWKEMVTKYMIEEATVDPTVTLVANDNWLEFTVRYVADYKRRRSAKDRLFTRILEEFDGTGGRVGVASMTVHLVETPVFDVRLAGQPEKESKPARPQDARPDPTSS